jgi:hypothetical protein
MEDPSIINKDQLDLSETGQKIISQLTQALNNPDQFVAQTTQSLQSPIQVRLQQMFPELVAIYQKIVEDASAKGIVPEEHPF